MLRDITRAHITMGTVPERDGTIGRYLTGMTLDMRVQMIGSQSCMATIQDRISHTTFIHNNNQQDITLTTWTDRTNTMVIQMPTGIDQMDNTETTWTGRTTTTVCRMPTGRNQVGNITKMIGDRKVRKMPTGKDQVDYNQEDTTRKTRKQEGPQDANRQRSSGQYTQEDEIQEVQPNINRQQKPAGTSQDNNKNRQTQKRNPNIDGGSRLEDFPGMTLTQRANEMFFEASMKAESSEARNAIDTIARAIQDLGQSALDATLGRHTIRAIMAKNQSDTSRRGYEMFRFATDVLKSVEEYKNEELVGILQQIKEETQYIHQQYKLENDGIEEYLKRLHDQRAERDKRKMTIPHYEGWSHKKTKVKDSARSQEQKPIETRTSYAEAAKADTAQAKKETGAISKRGRTPPRNNENSDNTEKERKEDADGDDSNDGWQQPREKVKHKRRQVQEEKRKK